MWVERHRLTAWPIERFLLHRSSMRSSRTSCPLLRHDSQPGRGLPIPVGGVLKSWGLSRSSSGRSGDHAMRDACSARASGRIGTAAAPSTARLRARTGAKTTSLPVAPLKPSLTIPWPEWPKGTIGRAFATVCFLAALDSGGRTCFDPLDRHPGRHPVDCCPHLRAGRRDERSHGRPRSRAPACSPARVARVLSVVRRSVGRAACRGRSTRGWRGQSRRPRRAGSNEIGAAAAGSLRLTM